jgi:hypothetical protein
MKKRISWLVLGLGLGLLTLSALRVATAPSSALTPLAGLVTPGYVGVVVVFTLLLMRAGLPLNRVGFGDRLSLRHILLAIVAIGVLRVTSFALEPIWEALLDGPRNMTVARGCARRSWAPGLLLVPALRTARSLPTDSEEARRFHASGI